MALWRRSGIASVVTLRRFRVLEQAFPSSTPMFSHTHFRYYVALGQVKPKVDWRKPKVENDEGIRINEAIKEREVRLVTDEGHRVVSIQEALYRARTLDLDLVEVQRKVKVEGGAQSNVFKPAVCKLMDYCKEKYKQDVKEKGRSKPKAAIVLRNGENKEVRFKAKTELKDLKIKAESVKRLMERGYRVKCTAMPSGKDDEDRGGLLLSLLALIEDISIVESGPHLDAKNAYVIVKHVKFSPKKGKKVSKALETVSNVLSTRSNAAADNSVSKDENVVQAEEVWETVESDSENEIKFTSPESTNNETERNEQPEPKPHVPETNRYSKGSNSTSHHNRPTNRDEQSGRREIEHRRPSNPNDRPAYNHHPNSSSPRHGVFGASQGSGSNHRTNPNAPNVAPPQKYGVFNSAKPSPSSNSSTSSYGIFSTPKIISTDDQMKRRDNDSDKSNNASPQTPPKFGVFISSKKASSGDGRLGDKN